MKKLLLLLSLFAFVTFSSCDKGKLDKDDYNKEDYDKEDYDKEDWGDKDEWDKEVCFHLVYPVTYTMPDGTTITGGEEEVWDAIKAWYEAHPDSEEKPALQYPVDIVFEDEDDGDITKTIANEEDMIKAKKGCYDEWKEDCFYLVYPVTYTMPDGTMITGGDEEVWDAIKAWYEAHPDSEEKPALEYPVDIIFEDEEDGNVTKTIANEEEMIETKKDCYYEEKAPCFDFVYPITFTMPDGTTISGEEEELWEAIKAWYEAHPDSAEEPALQYPVNIVFEENDEVVTVVDETAMMEIKTDCYEDKEACFDLVFPLTFTMPDGTTISGNEEEVDEAMKAWYEAHPDSAEEPAMQYPVDIVLEDGTTQTIANDEEMILAKEDCYVDDGE